jgi:hypothetical protein
MTIATGRVLTGCVLLAELLAVTGCVPANNARNWLPQRSEVDATYYKCLQEAQQGYALAGGAASGGTAAYSASAGATTNIELLKSCMQAAGYQKRDPTSAEATLGLITAPLWVPICFVAALGGLFNCLGDV